MTTGSGGAPLRARLDDRGQVTVEFTGMVPLILVTLALLWQVVLVGYTFTLAGDAADEARAATAAHAGGERPGGCAAAARERAAGRLAGRRTWTARPRARWSRPTSR